MMYLFNRVMRCFIFLAILSVLCIVSSGCTPSIRYTRNSGLVEESVQNGNQRTAPARPTVFESDSFSQDRLRNVINSYIGTPYRYGGTDRRGFDCSGFVLCIYRDVFNITLPHNSSEIHNLGKRVSILNAQTGDLIFFRGRWRRINHVGIYLGEGRFAHSSSNRGVIYSDLTEEYYKNHFAGLRRFFIIENKPNDAEKSAF